MVVKIDYDKCLGAKECGQCMKKCPLGVFMNVPEGKFEPIKKLTKYKIIPYFYRLCTGCKICKKNCPKKCIEIY